MQTSKKNILISLLIIFFIFNLFTTSAAAKYQKSELLISAPELKQKLENKNENEDLKIIDVRSSFKYLLGHIPQAVNLQPRNFSNDQGWVAGLIAEPQNFSFAAQTKGINNNSEIIIYADQNSIWPARLWWVFRVYGTEKLRILKGGFKAWEKEGFADQKLAHKPKQGNFEVQKVNNNFLIATDTIAENLNNKDFLILDTRSKAEYLGQKTKAGAPRKGKIPGSVHLDWNQILDENNNFKSIAVIEEIFKAKGINKNKGTIVILSHKGVKAAFTFFSLKLLGYNNLKLYDDSWLGWSNRRDLSIQ